MRFGVTKFTDDTVILKSKKDTIKGVAFSPSASSILPEELFHVIVNNIKPYLGMSNDSRNYRQVLSHLSTFSNLTKDIYWYVYKLLLYLEHYQCIMNMKEYSLYDQMIQPSKHRKNEFLIRLPQLPAEGSQASLRVHDNLEIYQASGKKHTYGIIQFIDKNYVSVSVSKEFIKQFKLSDRYNIEFHHFSWEINNLNYVLDTFHNKQLISMLFPEKRSESMKQLQPIKWIDNKINNNPEQQQAIINIINKTAQPAPYILFGPPGTGKTSTLVEAVCQILKNNSSSRILICTPSNTAADEIAIRLYHNSIDKDIMYRMYSATKDSTNVNSIIKGFSNFSDSKAIFISKNVFLRKKIIITTLSTSIRLYKYKLHENYFSYIICDEAGQATELATLTPLLLMSSVDSDKVGRFSGQIVLAGDPKQLGPIILSRLAKPLLSKSMLERLLEWGPYKKSIISNKYDAMYVTKLIRNYRSHPVILHLPNKLFYENELIPKAGNEVKRGENWSGLLNKKFPIIFHAVEGTEARKANSWSVYNLSEVDIVLKYVKHLLNTELGGKVVQPHDIGIITPYTLQKIKITKGLEENNINNISVGTVELFQGQERDIIIFSSVRTNLYMNEGNVHIGHLSNPKRFNVALTRPRALLIVIGDSKILQHDEAWFALIQYCIDNDSYIGDKSKLSKKFNKSEIHKLIAKKHVITSKDVNVQKPIVELSDQESDNVNVEIDIRRRRLPIGPLPENVNSDKNYFHNSRNNVIHNRSSEVFHLLKIKNNNDENAHCPDIYNNNDDLCEYITSNDLQLSSPLNDHTVIGSHDIVNNDDNFEVELQKRMSALHIN